MLEQIRKKIENLIGKKVTIFVDVGRNKNESYEGIILDTYKNVWTIKTSIDNKSFSYSDILIKNVIINSPLWWFFILFSIDIDWLLNLFIV